MKKFRVVTYDKRRNFSCDCFAQFFHQAERGAHQRFEIVFRARRHHPQNAYVANPAEFFIERAARLQPRTRKLYAPDVLGSSDTGVDGYDEISRVAPRNELGVLAVIDAVYRSRKAAVNESRKVVNLP